MGSTATVWALDAAKLERFLQEPAPLPPEGRDEAAWAELVATGVSEDDELREELRALGEQVPWSEAVVATWRDPADNDLSRLPQGEAIDPLPVALAATALERPALAVGRPATEKVHCFAVLAEPERAALRHLGAVLGLEPHDTTRVPWWVLATWSPPGDGFWIGLLAPAAVQALDRDLRATRALERLVAWDAALRPSWRQKSLPALGALLARAAAEGAWVLGVEGQS